MRNDRLAIDVGGTFTDVVRLDGSGALRFEKVPTTPDDPARGVLDSVDRIKAALAHTSMFTHGTTLGLNALLTRSGARTAVVATSGFRNVYLLGHTSREGNYDILYRNPPRLVERCDTLEVIWNTPGPTPYTCARPRPRGKPTPTGSIWPSATPPPGR